MGIGGPEAALGDKDDIYLHELYNLNHVPMSRILLVLCRDISIDQSTQQLKEKKAGSVKFFYNATNTIAVGVTNKKMYSPTSINTKNQRNRPIAEAIFIPTGIAMQPIFIYLFPTK